MLYLSEYFMVHSSLNKIIVAVEA